MEKYYCYENCYHGGQFFHADTWYFFADPSLLPHGKKGEIRHFEPVIKAETPKLKKEMAEKSPGIQRLQATIDELNSIKNPTAQDKATIGRLQRKIAQLTGDEQVGQNELGTVVLPHLDDKGSPVKRQKYG